MATYKIRNGRVTAQVNIKPLPRRARTFDTQAAAYAWATEMETRLRGLKKTGNTTSRLAMQTGRLPTTSEEISNLPRLKIDVCGIYFLFRNNVCVYVGKSRQIHIRVREHRLRKASVKNFDSYSWILCSEDELDQKEQYFIKLLDPAMNVAATPRFAQVQLAGVRAHRKAVRIRNMREEVEC